MELFSDLGNRPLVLIRFNPDKTKISNGCFSYKDNKLVVNEDILIERMKKLFSTIDSCIISISDKEISIINLYFD